MKFKKLLVLSALSLMGMNAWAAVPEGVWTMPEPQGLEFTTFTDDGTRFYLYNPGAKLFFASGNSWNTQASVRVYGYPVWLEVATEDGAPDGSYELWNYVDNPQRTDVTGNHNVFFDGGSFFVDHASQAGYTWNYTIEGEFVRLGVVTSPDKFIGWDGTYIDSDDEGATCSSVLKNLDPAAEGVCVDWKAVTEESYEAFRYGDDYEAYCNGVKAYIASLGLKKALEDAEAAGLTCAAALAVYSNNGSTIDELREAKKRSNYVFLKTLFDSQSNPADKSTLTMQQLVDASDRGLIDRKVYAMGGMNLDNISTAKDLGFGGVVICGDLWNRFDIHNELDYKELLLHFERLRKATE